MTWASYPRTSLNRACRSCGEDDPMTTKTKRLPGAPWLCADCTREEAERLKARETETKEVGLG